MPHTIKLLTAVFVLLFSYVTQAQTSKKPFDSRVNVVFGLTQPLLANGFNFEVDLFYKRLAFDFSHGMSLDFAGSTVSGEIANQQLAVHIPYTTGFGIGYRFTRRLNLRVEPKWHLFDIYHEGDVQSDANRIVMYETFSLGLGAYYNWMPFENKTGFLKGLMIAPSIRFWPTVSSTLPGEKFAYRNKMTGRQEVHERMEPGISNTPLVINISVGYSFEVFNKKK